MLETHPGQADPAGNFVGDVLPVDVSYPGAGDVLHATTAHPDLQGSETGRVREQETPDKMSERVPRQINGRIKMAGIARGRVEGRG